MRSFIPAVDKTRTILTLVAAALLLSGCGVMDWFDKKKPPLPGERQSVFQDRREI